MDGPRFDAWAKTMAGRRTRRQVLKGLTGGTAGGLLAMLRYGGADAQTCRPAGRTCSTHGHCCSSRCGPKDATGRRRCACPDGQEECRGICVDRTGGYAANPVNCGACGHICPRTRCERAICHDGVCGLAPDPAMLSRACDDGDACTTNDVCRADGSCAGTPIVCDDGLACTTDTCIDGACVATLHDGFCLIDGACVAAGTPHPDNPCQLCDPDQSTTAWGHLPNGLACDDGSACTANDICQNGVCVGTPVVICTAPDECHDPGTCDPSSGVCSPPEPKVNFQTDGRHCGKCGSNCDGNKPWSVCIGGSCQCPSGRYDCGGLCAELCSARPDHYRRQFQDCLSTSTCDYCASKMYCHGSIDTETTCGTISARC